MYCVLIFLLTNTLLNATFDLYKRLLFSVMFFFNPNIFIKFLFTTVWCNFCFGDSWCRQVIVYLLSRRQQLCSPRIIINAIKVIRFTIYYLVYFCLRHQNVWFASFQIPICNFASIKYWKLRPRCSLSYLPCSHSRGTDLNVNFVSLLISLQTKWRQISFLLLTNHDTLLSFSNVCAKSGTNAPLAFSLSHARTLTHINLILSL